MTDIEEKQVAVISGAMGYVGFEVAKKLALDGFSVAMLYHTTPQATVGSKLTSLSGSSHAAYSCDLSVAHNIASTFEAIEKEQGKIYACIHAAGKKPERKKLYLSTLEEFQAQFEGNVTTSFNFLTESARRLKEHKTGIIVGLTTIGVMMPEATRSLGAYIPAKYAVQGMLTMLQEEMLPYGIRTHAILSGFMPEGMNADIPRAFVQMLQEKSKTHTLAEASDIAEVISGLCKNEDIHDKRFIIPVAPEYGLL